VRRVLVLTAILTVGLVAPPAGAPARADEGGTPCAFEADVSLSPGLSRSPSSGTFTTKGESGSLDCQGDVGGGQPATGRGTFGADGRYGTGGSGDSCDTRSGQGDGTAHYTVPVDGGSRHIDDPFTLTYRVDGRSVVGQITGQRFSGTFDVTKANGDCFWHAITKIHIKGKGHLQPEQQPEPAPVPLPGG
jgi:hypothetical protein